MSLIFKRYIPVGLVSFITTMLIIDYFTKITPINYIASIILLWSVPVAGHVLFMGTFSLISHHVKMVLGKDKIQSLFSLWLIICFVVMVVFGLSMMGIGGTTLNQLYTLYYTNVYTVISNTLWGLAGFYMAAGAYRAFRANNLLALTLLVSASLTLLGITSIGEFIWPGFTTIKEWIGNVASGGVYTAITISLGIGLISFGLRIILGVERTWLGRGG